MKKNIASSFLIITFFSVLDRLLGFVLKIFLSRMLGAEGMGLYQMGFSVFSLMLAFVVGGIPLVVSKLVARHQSDANAQNKITSAALALSLITSTILIVLFSVCYTLIGAFLPTSVRSLVVCMLPTLVFSSVYASLRGHLWGKQKFFLVSVVEVIEQISRIGVCAGLFLLGFNNLVVAGIALSVGSLISSIFCIIFFLCSKGKFVKPKNDIKTVFSSCAPITLSHVVGALSSAITSILIPILFVSSGYSQSQANSMLGSSLGMALPLLHVPVTIVSSLAFVLIPTIGAKNASTDAKSINSTIVGALKFATIVACVFIPFFISQGENICLFVYNDGASGMFLKNVSWALIPLVFECVTSSLMNSLDMEMRGFINGIIGYACLWLVSIACYGNFTDDALSFGLGASWTLTSFLHLLCIKKKTALSFGFLSHLIKCLLLCIPTIMFVNNLYSLIEFLPHFLCLAISGIASATFFVLLSLVFDVFSFDLVVKKRKKATI